MVILSYIDKTKREEHLCKLQSYLEKHIKSNENLTNETITNVVFPKIWKSLFYCYLINLVFWNADKPVYQKQMAERIAKLLENCKHNEEIEKSWMKSIVIEFSKKWTQIDFLRLDKYIFLLQTVIIHFFNIYLEEKQFSVKINNSARF